MNLLDDKNVYKEYREQTKSIHSKVVKQLLDLKKLNGKIQGWVCKTSPTKK